MGGTCLPLGFSWSFPECCIHSVPWSPAGLLTSLLLQVAFFFQTHVQESIADPRAAGPTVPSLMPWETDALSSPLCLSHIPAQPIPYCLST